MKIIKNKKRKYSKPIIEQIKLDNEISLVLQSDPPIGPGEARNINIPEFFNINPYNLA